MKGATHYIELYKCTKSGKEYQNHARDINEMERNLKLTKPPLKTIAVFKIKFKPGFLLATHDEGLGATIVENGSI